MKVGIIGAGIGGLTLARALQTKKCGVASVKVFEKHNELRPALGGALGLTGGAVILTKLGLGDELLKIGTVTQTLEQRAHGETLRRYSLKDFLDRDRATFQYKGKLIAGAYMRDILQQTLADSLEPNTLILGEKLASINQDSGHPLLWFSNGEVRGFDLVFGADGIRSTVYKEVLNGPYEPKFSGFRVLYAVAPPINKRQPNTIIQDFRNGSMWLMLSAGGENQFDICAVPMRWTKYDEFNWTKPCSEVDLMRACETYDAPNEARRICSNATRIFDWGVHFHKVPETWHNGRVVLLGDSVHAMTPFMGQGANQAAIDAYSIADKLERLENGEFENLEAAIKEYERIRKPVAASINRKSGLIGQVYTLSPPLSNLRNFFFVHTDFMIKTLVKEMKPIF